VNGEVDRSLCAYDAACTTGRQAGIEGVGATRVEGGMQSRGKRCETAGGQNKAEQPPLPSRVHSRFIEAVSFRVEGAVRDAGMESRRSGSDIAVRAGDVDAD
jgi:hypothetical protein